MVTVFAALAQRLELPYPILLTLAGTAIALVPHMPRVRLDPDLIFVIFLPPLLYDAAWQTNVRQFKRNLVFIAMLALGLVAFTVIGVALFSDHSIAPLDWKSGLVLGALICTTDVISATSIAKDRRHIQREALQRERAILLRLRDNGAIGDDVQRRLERELDLSESRLAG